MMSQRFTRHTENSFSYFTLLLTESLEEMIELDQSIQTNRMQRSIKRYKLFPVNSILYRKRLSRNWTGKTRETNSK